eukprot:gene16896-12092_t
MSRSLRQQNRLPGVIYGVDDDKNVLKVMVTVDTKEVKKQIRTLGRSFENTIHEIAVPIEGKPEPLKFQVVPRTTQFCALTLEPLCVNYLRYRPGTRVSIPLAFINQDRSADLKRGSFITRVNKFIDCVCDEEIPAQLEIDVSDAAPGQVYRLNNINFPPKVRPAKTVPPDFVAAIVKSPR